LKLASTRLATLRHEGTATLDGRRVARISFNADKNIRVTLAVDAETGRVAAMEQLAPDPLLGLDTTRWTFHGTQTIDALVLPQRASVFRRGIEVLDIRIVSVQFDDAARVGDADFTADPKYQPFEAPPLEVAEVRPGVWEVANAGQGFYRVQFVELADRLVAYDAPGSPSQVRAVVDKLREKVPGKRISHVVLSHFHNDHIGGVRTFAELGAKLVTTADAVPVVRRIAAAQVRLASLDDTPVPALEFVTVDGRLELGDASRRVTVLEAPAGPHVNRLLVLADAASGTAIAADVYSDATPFNATFDWFAQWLRREMPATNWLLGAHHPPAEVKTILERQAQFRAGGGRQAAR
jgi:glyoxylase-like metal-dependent hydrolase (beta-lactamase superfamily II)